MFRPLTVTVNPPGVHFIDCILAADVFQVDDSWQVHLLGRPVGALRMPDVDANDAVRAARAA